MAVYNVEKISSWLDKFSNAKTAYNKDYSKYKGTYIYTTTESTVNRIKQDLSKNYDRIQKIYKNIYNQWNNYLNDLKATDNYLAGAGSSGAIKASSVSSRLSKLPKLKEYHAGAYEKLSAVNAKLGTIKTVGWTDGKTIDENLSNVMAKTGATISVAAVSIVEGVGIFAEGLVDCAALVAGGVGTALNYTYGFFANDLDSSDELNELMWKDVRAFVSKEHVKTAFDSFYENNDTGKSMKENAFGFDMVRSIGNEVGEVVGAVTVSALTGGVVNPAVFYGISKAGNHVEENWQDENTSTQAGLVKGVFQGVGDGVFFAIGLKGDKVMKKAATEAVKKGGEQALKKTAILSVKTLFESGCSVAQDGSNILINALFSNDTVKTQSGEIIRLNTFSDKLNYYYQEAGGAQGLVNSMATASILSFTSDFVDVGKIGKNVNASDAIKNVDINTSSVKKNMSEINPKNLDISSGSKKINMDVDIDSLKREYDELIKWKNSDEGLYSKRLNEVYGDRFGSSSRYKKNMARIAELETKLFNNNSDQLIKNANNTKIKKVDRTIVNPMKSDINLDYLRKEYDDLINWKNSDEGLYSKRLNEVYGDRFGSSSRYKKNMARIAELETKLFNNNSDQLIKNANNTKIKEVDRTIESALNTKHGNLSSPANVINKKNVVGGVEYGSDIATKLEEITKSTENNLKNTILSSVDSNYNEIQKIRKIYIELNKHTNYDAGFVLGNENTKNSILNKVTTFDNLTNNNVVCKGWSELYAEALVESGIDPKRVNVVKAQTKNHWWVEINIGDKIIRADATEALLGSTDLANCKFGEPTNGFLILNKSESGKLVDNKILSNNPKVLKRSNDYFRDVDKSINYVGDNGYFTENVTKLQNLFKNDLSPYDDVIKNVDVLKNNAMNYMSMDIPKNMNGYDAFVYYRKLSNTLFGNKNNVAVPSLKKISIDGKGYSAVEIFINDGKKEYFLTFDEINGKKIYSREEYLNGPINNYEKFK